jgi:hypothetical protein
MLYVPRQRPTFERTVACTLRPHTPSAHAQTEFSLFTARSVRIQHVQYHTIPSLPPPTNKQFEPMLVSSSLLTYRTTNKGPPLKGNSCTSGTKPFRYCIIRTRSDTGRCLHDLLLALVMPDRHYTPYFNSRIIKQNLAFISCTLRALGSDRKAAISRT